MIIPKSFKRVYAVIAVIATILTVFTAIPGTWHSITCWSVNGNCEKSLYGPRVDEIQVENISAIQSSFNRVEDVKVEEIDPLFSKPILKVSAATASETKVLGYVYGSLTEETEFIKLTKKGKYILAQLSGRESELHLFDTNSRFEYAYILLECSNLVGIDSGFSRPEEIILKNIRWHEKNENLPERLAFDIISNCHLLNFNGGDSLYFGDIKERYARTNRSYLLHPEANGRVIVEFSPEFVPEKFYSEEQIEYEEAILAYENSIIDIDEELELCIEKIAKQLSSRQTPQLCRAQYPPAPLGYQYSFYDSRNLFAIITIGTDGLVKVVRDDCYEETRLLRNLPTGYMALVCTEGIDEIGNDEAPLWGSRTGFYISRFRGGISEFSITTDATRINYERFRIDGPGKYSFNIYSDSNLISIDTKKYEIPQKNPSLEKYDKETYRGRFSLTLGINGSINEFSETADR